MEVPPPHPTPSRFLFAGKMKGRRGEDEKREGIRRTGDGGNRKKERGGSTGEGVNRKRRGRE